MKSLKKIILLIAALSLNIQAVCSEEQQQNPQPTTAAQSAYCSVLHCWQRPDCPAHIVENIVDKLDFNHCQIGRSIYHWNIWLNNQYFIVISHGRGNLIHNDKCHLLNFAQVEAILKKLQPRNAS